jgi:hypothetical protein
MILFSRRVFFLNPFFGFWNFIRTSARQSLDPEQRVAWGVISSPTSRGRDDMILVELVNFHSSDERDRHVLKKVML